MDYTSQAQLLGARPEHIARFDVWARLVNERGGGEDADMYAAMWDAGLSCLRDRRPLIPALDKLILLERARLVWFWLVGHWPQSASVVLAELLVETHPEVTNA